MIVKLLALTLVLALQTSVVASQAAPTPESDAQAAFALVISMVKKGGLCQDSRIAALKTAYPQLSANASKIMLQLAQAYLCQELTFDSDIVYDDVCRLMGIARSPLFNEQIYCSNPNFIDLVLPYEHPKYRKARGQDEE